MSGTSNHTKSQAFRLLALDYSITQSEWDITVFQKIYKNLIFQPILSNSGLSPSSELVERTAHLFSLLLFEGGISVARPVNKFTSLRIDFECALNGCIRWTDKTTKTVASNKHQLIAGPRQFLYAAGRCALISYLLYQIKIHQAKNKDEVENKSILLDGSLLVPTLTPEIFRTARVELIWLKSVKGNPTWQKVFSAFLLHKIDELGLPPDERDRHVQKIDFSDLSNIAQLNLYRSELPIQIEGRSGKIIPAAMSNDQFRDFLPVMMTPKQKGQGFESEPVQEQESIETAEEFALPQSQTKLPVTNASQVFRSAAVEQARRFLDNIRDSKSSYSKCIEIAEQLQTQNLKTNYSSNINYFYSWLITQLAKGKKKGNVPLTVLSYAQKLLYIIESFVEHDFTTLELADFIVFFSQYFTANTIKAYQTVAKKFHQFIETELRLQVVPIKWNSPLLKSNEGYREKALINEESFAKIWNHATAAKLLDKEQMEITLLLLRRCGLRCAEAAALQIKDFYGDKKLRLFVQTSKSDAGKRTLPLYLLLDKAELKLTKQRLNDLGKSATLTKSHFFLSKKDGNPLDPDEIGNEILRVFKAAQIDLAVTAHDLRHAFATAIFSAWYLNLSEYRDSAADNWARQALKKLCRPDIEGRALKHCDDIRRLMGHASLEVTFERYIHSFDLTVADTIFKAEGQMPDRYLSRRTVLNLMGISERHLRRVLTSKPKSIGVAEYNAFTPFDENDLRMLTATASSTGENNNGSDKKLHLNIQMDKVEHWLKEKLLSETKKKLTDKKITPEKLSTRKRSIIKKF